MAATKAQLAALKKGRETRARNAAKKKKAPVKRKVAAKRKTTPQNDDYVVYTTFGGEEYYLADWGKNGAVMDSIKSKAKKFNRIGATTLAKAVEAVHAGTKASVKKLNATRARNPVPPSSVAKSLEQAGHLYREFTGHDATHYDEIPVTPMRVGLKVGSVDAILYTTVRDGITEHYIHEFKRSSRPTLVASHDGRALALVGGRYRFTDRGIVDK